MIIEEIRNELTDHSDPEEKKKRIHWEKQYQERPKFYGIPLPIVRKTSLKFYQNIKSKPKHEILQLCEALLESGYSEERTIAFDWAFRIRRSYEETDFKTLETWLQRHVHSWGACDDLCTHALGAFIYQFPDFIHRSKEWAKSRNRWMRRASAVVMIYSMRRKTRLSAIFEIADMLMADQDVMVQKGFGWMLKEASKNYPEEIFSYVMSNQGEMPRTALRYAIEKLSLERRREAMKKK